MLEDENEMTVTYLHEYTLIIYWDGRSSFSRSYLSNTMLWFSGLQWVMAEFQLDLKTESENNNETYGYQH